MNPLLLSLVTGLSGIAAVPPPEQPLADYFGFEGLEIVTIDEGAGPLRVADINGDKLLDLIVVNNHSSRIELHLQKPGATPDDERPVTRANQIPEHWRYRKVLVPV